MAPEKMVMVAVMVVGSDGSGPWWAVRSWWVVMEAGSDGSGPWWVVMVMAVC